MKKFEVSGIFGRIKIYDLDNLSKMPLFNKFLA